jgi:hypothetical protein
MARYAYTLRMLSKMMLTLCYLCIRNPEEIQNRIEKLNFFRSTWPTPCISPLASPNQEIPDKLRNPKAHYRICKNSPRVPILSHINPSYNHPPSSSVGSHVLIPRNLNILSSTKIISLITLHFKIFVVLFHQAITVYKSLLVDATLKNTCTISLCNFNTTYHFLGRTQTAR